MPSTDDKIPVWAISSLLCLTGLLVSAIAYFASDALAELREHRQQIQTLEVAISGIQADLRYLVCKARGGC